MDRAIEQTSSRVLVGSGPILSIQYLRAFAALAVVASHAIGFLMGQAGVDVFFVISGFIMWVTIARGQTVVTFLRNRVIRIAPLYWMATIIMGLYHHAGGLQIAKSMLFIPYYGQDGQIWPVLVQGWTLNYEMFFYGLIAIILLMPSSRRLPAIITIIALLSLSRLLINTENAVFKTYTNSLLFEFCFGIGLAELWFRRRIPPPAAVVPLALISIVLAFLYLPDTLPTTMRFLVWGIPSALLVTAGLSCEAAGLVGRIRLLLMLGDASYAVYLFHIFTLRTVIHLVNSSVPGVDLIAVMTVSTVIGCVIAFWVEKPILRYLRSHIRPALAA